MKKTLTTFFRNMPPFIAIMLPLAGCQGGDLAQPAGPAPGPPDAPIVAFYADDAGPKGGAGAVGNEKAGKSFYLGVRRDLLGERWFLSAYLEQLYPSSMRTFTPSVSLGTRVVSFRVQNDKLFVFDVDDRKAWSDTFDPEVVVEAYPLVAPHRLGPAAASGDYVVFDPAAGQNRFSVLNDSPHYSTPLEVGVTFSQNFRAINDGVTFEQAFNGYFRDAGPGQLFDPRGLEVNDYRVSGTLGFALRRYREGEGFEAKVLPGQGFYFESAPRQVVNQRRVDRPIAHWALAPGAAPIRWAISPSLVRAQAERYPDYDLVGAFRRGVESWNAAFGFEALRAEIASPEESFADDDVNYVIFDENVGTSGAYADWRLNPNTGEIRGASVYFPEAYVVEAITTFSDDPSAGAPPRTRPDGAKAARFAWGPMGQEPLCDLGPRALGGARPARGAPSALTAKEKAERLLSHIVAHEIGHTLGLRHNFKGSLAPPSSSVMEYVVNEDAALVPDPGPYDVDAVRYLYGLSAEPPSQPFCNDDGVFFDAACNRFDVGVDPLTESLAPAYRDLFELFALGGAAGFEDDILFFELPIVAGEVLDYVRAAATSEEKRAAWDALFAPLRAPFDPAHLPENVDLWARRLVSYMIFEDPFEQVFANISAPIGFDAALTPLLVADLRDVVVDAAGARGVETRSKAVDALKSLRQPAALFALDEARAALEASLPSLGGEARAFAEDLLRHIDAATGPYFD